MTPLVRPELPTPARHPASYRRSAGRRASVDNSALFPTRSVPTYKSGIAVQTNRATSKCPVLVTNTTSGGFANSSVFLKIWIGDCQ